MRTPDELPALMEEMPVKGAVLSPAFGDAPPEYRYALWRQWDTALPLLAVVMLNPSTADARVDDPTVTRLVRHARKHGYGGFIVVNLFAFRSADPFALLKRGFRNSEGPGNDDWIHAVCKGRDVLVAWGVGTYGGRAAYVAAMLQSIANKLVSFGINKDGSPPHPSRLGYDVGLIEWAPKKAEALL